MTDKPKKRIIIPKRDEPSITVVNDTENLLNDAKMIIAAELARYRGKAMKGVSLDLKEARVVQGYLDSLTKLQKEEREHSRSQDLSNLSDEELVQLAQQLLGSKKPKLVEDSED